ncbi:DUF423 domain-containing protein [Fodinicurvata sp. EGI_FJ10296]|uniref:DUF423 domain-containing protein n=1 Tax=Fodinicurvata sp. EGI_FJ10296 TaxID=3231908 RepID=UPI003452A451
MGTKMGTTVAAGTVMAAINGLLAVAMGAIGAHGGSGEHSATSITTGSTFQLAHAGALVGLAALADRTPSIGRGRVLLSGAVWLIGPGAAVFAVALYASAFGTAVAGAAPFGGLAMIAGWCLLLAYGVRSIAVPAKSSRPSVRSTWRSTGERRPPDSGTGSGP